MGSRTAVLVHGLWHSARIWERWVSLLALYGISAVAVDWPGEREGVVDVSHPPPSFRDVVGAVEHVAAALPDVVLVGVGAGALIAQTVADRVPPRGLVALAERSIVDAVPIDARRRPGQLFAGPDPLAWRPESAARWLELDSDEYAAYFGNALGREESDRMWRRYAVPTSGRLLSQLRGTGLVKDSAGARRPPQGHAPRLHVITGRNDSFLGTPLAPPQVRDELAGPRWGPVEVVELTDRGQTLVFDDGGAEVATLVARWISRS